MYNFSTVIAIITLLIFVLFCFVLFCFVFFRLPTKQWKKQEEQFLNWGKK